MESEDWGLGGIPCLGITKARSMIGFEPTCDIRTMLETGFAMREGQDTGVMPA